MHYNIQHFFEKTTISFFAKNVPTNICYLNIYFPMLIFVFQVSPVCIELLNNKLPGGFVSPYGGFASLDQPVSKKLAASSSQSEMPSAFCIDQIVPGFVVYHLNC